VDIAMAPHDQVRQSASHQDFHHLSPQDDQLKHRVAGKRKLLVAVGQAWEVSVML
jgi:hypothetical protein